MKIDISEMRKNSVLFGIISLSSIVSAHSSHKAHSEPSNLLPVLGTVMGLLVMSAGLYFSARKYFGNAEEVSS